MPTSSSNSTRPWRRARALLASVVLVTALPSVALGWDDDPVAHPNPPAAYVRLEAAAGAGQVVPLINSGQTFDGVTFEGIPDGLGVRPVGHDEDTVDIYVAFEQSHVPFGTPAAFADFEDSSVQRVRVDLDRNQVVGLEEVLPPSAGFIRFCSAFMAGPREGFRDYTFFVNEESNDVIELTPDATYGSDPSVAPFRQAGYSVYLDTKRGGFDEIAGLGRLNHENTVIVPGGWRKTVTLTGDDTFSAPSSQLYLHLADSPKQLMRNRGDLWAFQVTRTNEGRVDPSDPQNGANDYLDIGLNETWSGRFIRVPDEIAEGRTGERPQTALENWSNANNVFQFVRVEDIAYDPDHPRVVYFADTGATVAPDPVTGRLRPGTAPPVAPLPGQVASQGRIFRMVLNHRDPTKVDALSIVVDANAVGMRRPDNLDVGRRSIMVQEDTSNAKIWRYNLDASSPTWSHVATVTHPVPANASAGESSGIIDMSRTELGRGWWALDVQSHVNLPGVEGPFTYTVPLTNPPQTIEYHTRREDGQLLLMYIPGS